MKREYKYLKFIWFKDLTRWDVKNYIKQSSTQLNLSFLKYHIKEESKKVKIFEEKETAFGILGVNNKEGIFDAYLEYGKNINQPYKEVKEGWLAYNPYRINVGSIGLKTKEHKYEYISPAYVVFSCRETMLPEFLFTLFKTESFNKLITDNTTGSVRQILSFENLGNIQIPLPSIEVQRALVEDYLSKIKEAKEKEERANILEAEIETYLKTALGIETAVQEEKQSKYKYLKFIPFSKLSRWDIDYNKHIASGVFNFVSKYRIGKLSDVIQYIQYGTSNKANLENGISVLRMNNILKGELDLKDIKYIDNLEEKEVKSLILNKGDILFNRTNGKELVGKTCVFDVEGEYVFASYLIRISLNEKANPYFINYLFASSVIRNQIDAISRQITGQANVNSVEMSNLLFPLPPIEVQKEIAGVVAKMKAEIKLLRSEAENLKSSAKEEFEKSVFN